MRKRARAQVAVVEGDAQEPRLDFLDRAVLERPSVIRLEKDEIESRLGKAECEAPARESAVVQGRAKFDPGQIQTDEEDALRALQQIEQTGDSPLVLGADLAKGVFYGPVLWKVVQEIEVQAFVEIADASARRQVAETFEILFF